MGCLFQLYWTKNASILREKTHRKFIQGEIALANKITYRICTKLEPIFKMVKRIYVKLNRLMRKWVLVPIPKTPSETV